MTDRAGGIVVVELDPRTVPVGDDRLLETLRDTLAFCRHHLGNG